MNRSSGRTTVPCIDYRDSGRPPPLDLQAVHLAEIAEISRVTPSLPCAGPRQYLEFRPSGSPLFLLPCGADLVLTCGKDNLLGAVNVRRPLL